MDAKTKSIIIGAGVLLIISLVSAAALFLGKNTRITNTSGSDSLSRLPVISTAPSQNSPTVLVNQSNLKTFIGQVFNFQYPSGWGILTCNNSQNVELDPTNSTDNKGVTCDIALKPVTVVVSNRVNCQGDTVNLGGNQVIKSKVDEGSWTTYRWCVSLGSKSLDITHRVSSSGARGTSANDFSSQIEQVISTLKTNPQGS